MSNYIKTSPPGKLLDIKDGKNSVQSRQVDQGTASMEIEKYYNPLKKKVEERVVIPSPSTLHVPGSRFMKQ